MLKGDSKVKKSKPADKGQCRGASDKLDKKDSVRRQRGDKARKTSAKLKQQPCKYVPVDEADGAPFAHARTCACAACAARAHRHTHTLTPFPFSHIYAFHPQAK